jgi:hypothetical protein
MGRDQDEHGLDDVHVGDGSSRSLYEQVSRTDCKEDEETGKMAEGRRIQNLMAGGADQRLEEYVERYLKQKEPAALNELKSETSPFTTCTSPLGNAREVEVHRNPSDFYFQLKLFTLNELD